MKDKDVEKHIQRLLQDETALTPLEASKILGCRDRDVREHMSPSFYSSGRPKYITREVVRVRERMVEATQETVSRSRQMVRRAAAGIV